MNNSVVFVVGNEIIEKLHDLHGKEKWKFVLGETHEDYFGHHFITIEELDKEWNLFFQIVKKLVWPRVDNKEHVHILYKGNDGFQMMYMNEKSTRLMYEKLKDINIQDILHMLDTYERKYTDEISRYIAIIQEIGRLAYEHAGSLLFCLD